MKENTLTNRIWAVACFIITLMSAYWVVDFLLFFSKDSFWKIVFLPGYNFAGSLAMVGFLSVSFISLFCFARLGIRMLNTGKKFFEIPGAKRGAFKIATSTLFILVGTIALLYGILGFHHFIYGPLVMDEKEQSIPIPAGIVCSVLCILFYYLAYRLKKAAFKREELELLGEKI
ncbi:hypothetical protein [Chitinophaga silvatica]|nr:hypothetical protein [Chitinophaga silvatica]